MQFGGDEIVKAKAGAGSATAYLHGVCWLQVCFHSLQFETFGNAKKTRFMKSVLRTASGEMGIIEETYLYLPGVLDGKAIADTLGVAFVACS